MGMTVAQIEAMNRETMEKLREAQKAPHRHGDPLLDVPFYGYIDVDIFECPSFVMFTNNDSPVVKNIVNTRSFEPTSMKVWCRLAKTATGILDIGANVGVYSLCAAALRPDLPIHAFEPNPFAFARLRMHKMLNNFANIGEHKFAVGDSNKVTHFSWVVKPGGNISSGGGVGDSQHANVEKVLVEMHTLDGTGLAAQLGPHPLIKIDVEGGEVMAMSGMKEIIALKPDIILETFSAQACNVINDKLLPLGYTAYVISEDGGHLIAQDKLYPRAVAPPYDFNQFLSVKPRTEIEKILSQ